LLSGGFRLKTEAEKQLPKGERNPIPPELREKVQVRRVGDSFVIVESDHKTLFKKQDKSKPGRLSAEELLEAHGIRLNSYKPGTHKTYCPTCGNRNQSSYAESKCLSVTIDAKGTCWHCFGCGWSGPEKRPKQDLKPEYLYRDADGVVQFGKVRNPDPSGGDSRFWLARPDGRDGWIKGISATRDGKKTKVVDDTILYRADEVKEAIALGRAVAIGEGEKDVDNLWRVGIPATCNAHGAAATRDDAGKPLPKYTPKWKKAHSEQLEGADIVVFNDNDEAGYAHADAVCTLSLGLAKSIKRVDLAPYWPHMPVGADVSDWLANGGTREALDEMIAEAPGFTAAPPPPTSAPAPTDPGLLLPTIQIVDGEIARVVDEAEAALVKAKADVPFMIRAGMLVHPIKETLQAADEHKTEVTLLRAVQPEFLVYMLNKHAAVFLRYNERAKVWDKTNPPASVARSLIQKGQWPFPRVTGITTAPTMRLDGTILDRPGYDPATQLWYAPDTFLRVPALKDEPTREDALAALKLFEDLLGGFPFVDEVDKAVALAGLLTPLLRAACDVVPMFLFLAHVAGSGKSYLTDLISTVAHGRRAPAISKAANEEELEKRLGALVLAGVPVISIDNCTTNLSGVTLCQITERQLVSIRILGKSEMPECEYRGAVFANGNNITAEGDLTRRTVVCHLDAGLERPELRTFEFDPIDRVLGDRGAYIAAALTIACAYRVSGERVECEPIGSYGRWSKTVREPLIWLGKTDPVKSMEAMREEDPVRAAGRELYELWRESLGTEKDYTAAEMIAAADEQHQVEVEDGLSDQIGKMKTVWRPKYPDLRPFLELHVGFKGELDPQKLGKWLQQIRGQIHDGHKLVKSKEANSRRGATYRMQQVAKTARG
jgi:putative DNA primase/helicase